MRRRGVSIITENTPPEPRPLTSQAYTLMAPFTQTHTRTFLKLLTLPFNFNYVCTLVAFCLFVFLRHRYA